MAARRVRGPTGEHSLSENEVRILRYLAQRSGVAVSRDELQIAVLGYSPVTLSRAVDAAVARLRTKIEPRPTDPQYLLTIYGVGYRLESGGPADEPTPVPPAPRVPASQALLPLFGRGAELSALGEALAIGGCIVVFGPPGIGKTRLVREATQGRPNTTWVDLRDVTEAQSAVDATARALGSGPAASGNSALALAAGRLAPSAILVLDAADEVNASLITAIDVVTRVAPTTHVVITRRIALPGFRSMRIAGLPNETAVQLFLARAASAGATLPKAETDAVGRLCTDLAGNPLAIEHFAARTSVLAPTELAHRLRERPETLAGSDEDRPARVARRAWSFLDDDERQGLLELMHFHTPFEVPAAESVLSARPDRSPLEVLRSLVDQCLVASRESGRFEVYPLFRFAGLGRALPPDRPAHAASTRRWAEWCDGLARRATSGPASLPFLEEVLAHEADLKARFHEAVVAGEREALVDLALALSLLFERLGPTPAWLTLLDRAIDAAPDAARAPELRLHRAVLCFNTGQRDGGLSDLKSLATTTSPRAPWRAYTVAVAETVALLRADDPDTDEIIRRVTAEPEPPSSTWKARTAFAQGQLLRIVDRTGEAIPSFRRAADLYAQDDDPVGESTAWRQLALAYVAAGDARSAKASLNRIEALQRRCGRWNQPPNAEHHRGSILHEIGDLPAAEEALRAGLNRAVAAGLPTVAYNASLGWLLVERGKLEPARELLTSAWDAYQAAGHVHNTAIQAGALAFSELLLGRVDHALEVLEASASPCKPGASFPRLWVHGLAALIHLERGGQDAAQRHFQCFSLLRDAQLTAAGPLVDLVRARLTGHRPLLQAQVPSSITRVAYRTFGANTR